MLLMKVKTLSCIFCTVENPQSAPWYSFEMEIKKLTHEERDEAATKGWIEDQDFATKGWIEDQDFATKGWIEDQGFVNNTTFREAIDMLVSLMERQEENFKRYVESLHENHISLVSGMGEVYDFRIEKVEKRVDELERHF